MLTFSLFVIWMCFLYSVYGAVTISPKTEFPMNGESFTFTCENHISGNNINWAADVNIDVPSLTVSEPAEKTDGQVSIETDCLTPVSAVSSQRCTYYLKEGVEYETCESETQTSSPTGCTDTCNGETWAKVTVQYQYTQATHNPVEGNLRVRIKHTGDSNNPREIVWNSTNIQWVEGVEGYT
ncbi:uncharacterized protein LOC128234940 [Mya arenaria]|uniref:uncharacterized protein LOC128234940 n=1 Tax=Mya arenaria TaxID=6604 RepID=UPI0022E50310|nr:uncharacterized protein LOC128234940 [Mya arenaria]